MADGRRAGRRAPIVAGAGLVYVLAWLVGLVLVTDSLDAFASDAMVNRFFVVHHGATLVQSLLVHGVAGVALAVFAVGLSAWLARSGDNAERRFVVVTGVAAAIVSFAQVGLMAALYLHVDGDGSAATTRDVFNAINKADSVKLLLIALFVVGVMRCQLHTTVLPRWLVWLGLVVVVTLIVGAFAFIVDASVLDGVLTISLVALLVWVAAISVSAFRRTAPQAQT